MRLQPCVSAFSPSDFRSLALCLVTLHQQGTADLDAAQNTKTIYTAIVA